MQNGRQIIQRVRSELVQVFLQGMVFTFVPDSVGALGFCTCWLKTEVMFLENVRYNLTVIPVVIPDLCSISILGLSHDFLNVTQLCKSAGLQSEFLAQLPYDLPSLGFAQFSFLLQLPHDKFECPRR